MRESRPTWNRHHKQYLDASLEKSAVIAFIEFASDLVLDVSEAAALAKTKWLLKASIFHLGDEVALDLADIMAIEPRMWAQARGVDLLAGRPAKRVLLGDLRYCRSCLQLGNHSTLFQLTQVVLCPIHLEALRVGCPHCGRPISTSPLALARNHFYCGKCDRNLASERRRASMGGPIGHPSAERFAVVRRLLTEPLAPGEFRSELRWDRPGEIAASPVLVRVHHAHTLWGDPSMGSGLLNVKTESLQVDVADTLLSRPKYFALVRGAVISAFEELAMQLAKHVRLKEVPPGVHEAMHSAARVDIRISTVAAAFWQAAAAFGVLPFVLGELPPPAAKAQPFWSWLPAHAEAMRLVVRRQVQAFFVRSLIRMSKLRYGVQVAWSKHPDEALFLLPWRLRLTADPGRLELQIRSKTDSMTVERMAARYRRYWLIEAPADASPLGLVASPPAQRPTLSQPFELPGNTGDDLRRQTPDAAT
jgi:hypothetical protein